jgi:hypothetical protein
MGVCAYRNIRALSSVPVFNADTLDSVGRYQAEQCRVQLAQHCILIDNALQ